MDSITELDRATILRAVRTWTNEQRIRLIQDILLLIRTDRTEQPEAPTFAQAHGLLKTDRPPPTDTAIKQWLAERQFERYGA